MSFEEDIAGQGHAHSIWAFSSLLMNMHSVVVYHGKNAIFTQQAAIQAALLSSSDLHGLSNAENRNAYEC